MGGGTSVSVLVGGFTGAVPCEEEGIDMRFSSKTNASCLDASCLEVLRSSICECNIPC